MNWIVLLAILAFGFLFVAIEVFLTPGFTIFGILGAIFLIIGIILAFMNFPSSFAFLILIVSVLFIGLLLIWIFKFGLPKRIALKERESGSNGFKPYKKNYSSFLNKTGFARTPLRPSGTIEIQGEILSAVSDGEFIEVGSQVIVNKVEGNKLVVRKVPIQQ